MKHLIAIITALTLSSCATIPRGYEGARWECSFSQQCVDDYVAEVNALARLSNQDLQLWYQSQRQRNQAYRDIGNSLGAFGASMKATPMPPRYPAEQTVKIIIKDEQ